MKATVAARDLAAALKDLVAASDDAVGSASGQALLTAEAGRLFLTTTDFAVELVRDVAAEVEAEGMVTVPALALREFARRLPADGSATLSFQEGARLRVSCGRARTDLPTQSGRGWPHFRRHAGEPQPTAVPAAHLAAAIDAILPLVEGEEVHRSLAGILIHRVDGALRLVGTNKAALFGIEIPVACSAWATDPVVPRGSVKLLRDLAKATGGDLLLTATLGYLHAASDAGQVLTRLISDRYPDYEPLIPTGAAATVAVVAKTLRQAVERVAAVALDDDRQAMVAQVGAGTVRLEVHHRGADSAEEVEAETTGDMRLGLSPRLVRLALAALACERVSINLPSPQSPSLWYPTEPNGRFAVIMPMRV